MFLRTRLQEAARATFKWRACRAVSCSLSLFIVRSNGGGVPGGLSVDMIYGRGQMSKTPDALRGTRSFPRPFVRARSLKTPNWERPLFAS